jgi:dTDP-4-dehydrorhamnose 3,5-epimerase
MQKPRKPLPERAGFHARPCVALGMNTKPKFAAESTSLAGVLLIRTTLFSDSRGFFCESYNRREFARLGIDVEFVQDNHSKSVHRTLRGLHFQRGRPQAKLCRVVEGEVFDVAVDLRRDSPTYGRWTSVVLSGENGLQIYIPVGFAHGFQVLSPVAHFMYKCSDFYDPALDAGVAWDDPQIKVEWPLADPIISDKDRQLPRLSEAAVF